MSKAIRYRSGGKFLKNTLFSTTNSDFIGAHHGVETDAIFDPVLAAEEEAMTIASHKVAFGAAFGIDPALIEEVVVAWNGDPETLPKEDEPDALVQLPVPTPEPEPAVRTFEELVAQASTFAELKRLVAEKLA